MKKTILLISTFSLLFVGCKSDPTSQYTYRPPANINDGFDVGSLDEVNIDAKLIAKAVNKIHYSKYKEVHFMHMGLGFLPGKRRIISRGELSYKQCQICFLGADREDDHLWR